MPSSPFHGIFRSLNDSDEKSIFSFDEQETQPVEQPQTRQAGQQPMGTGGMQPQPHAQVGRIAVDIFEHDEYYIIKAPIAGVRLSDLDIEVNENVITIKGVRKQTDDVPPQKYYLQECYWGPFARSVTLPFPINAQKIRASFNKDCILKILIPKEEKVKIVRISEA